MEKRSFPNKQKLLKIILLIILLLGLTLGFYFNLHQYLSYTALKNHHQLLHQLKTTHPLIMIGCYVLIYILSIVFSFPGAVFLTLAGGYLFGVFLGTALTVIAATIGASLLFLAVKFIFQDWGKSIKPSKLTALRQGFKQDAFSYLLFLRLIPIFPFWLVNIVPALLHINFYIYVSATFIGIIPGSLIYILIGSRLSHFFSTNTAPNLSIFFDWPLLLALLGLGLLSISPIIYRKIKRPK